jgi:beta-glucuronidase
VLDESLRVYLNHPDVVGASIWQFCDVRVCEGNEARIWSGRPRTMNNKGTVDEYRRPKLAYDVVKRRMHEAAEAHG